MRVRSWHWRRWFAAWVAMMGAVMCPAASLPVMRLGGTGYVDMVGVCGQLGLRFTLSSSGRAMTLERAGHRASLTAEGHEMTVDDVRLWLGDPVIGRGGRLYISQTDFEKRLRPIFRPDLCGPPPRTPRVIVIDPGHGGVDHGAENPRLRVMEKTFTLDVALRLQRILDARGYRVTLTRTTDTKIELPMRPEIANQRGADLFISIHFDAGPPGDRSLHGSEIMSFPPVGQRSTDSWGKPGNDREETASPGNRNDLWNVVLANAIYHKLERTLGSEDKGEKIGHLAVLRGLDCPGVLVEPAFLSNDAEASALKAPAFRERLANILAAGIGDYAAEIDALGGRR